MRWVDTIRFGIEVILHRRAETDAMTFEAVRHALLQLRCELLIDHLLPFLPFAL